MTTEATCSSLYICGHCTHEHAHTLPKENYKSDLTFLISKAYQAAQPSPEEVGVLDVALQGCVASTHIPAHGTASNTALFAACGLCIQSPLRGTRLRRILLWFVHFLLKVLAGLIERMMHPSLRMSSSSLLVL